MNQNLLLADELNDERLEEVLRPLLELLNEKYRDTWYGDFAVTIEGVFGVKGRYGGVLVELPDPSEEYPLVTQALATLLRKSGSSGQWFDEDESEEDSPYRTPLRFSIVKRTIWLPSAPGYMCGAHLLVDVIDATALVAAERQIALLAEYLKDEANLSELSDDDLLMF